jgi:chemotaxis protein CheD
LNALAAVTLTGGEEVKSLYLHPGQMIVSSSPCSISTILGSCVAVCLYDEERGVGGMNHFLLPHFAGRGPVSARFGNVATEDLVNRLLSAGARREALRAKVFGGANVLESLRGAAASLGHSNVEVARRVLREQDIAVVAEDVVGNRGRKLIFRTDDGSALVRFLTGRAS